MQAPSPSDIAASQAALESLAAALNPRDFAAALTITPGRPIRLTVSSRHSSLAEDIHADGDWFWWSWAEPVGPVDDPLAAARKITNVLRAAPGPSDG